jgi:hypothetical protein
MQSKFFLEATWTSLKLGMVAVLLFTSGCNRNGYDPTKISFRPRIFIDGGPPVPILDEYDIAATQLGSFSDIFNGDRNRRVFGIWIGLDRRAAMTLQKETTRNIGRNLNLVINGVVTGFHPIEATISNGYIPFMFTQRQSEPEVMAFYQQLEASVRQLQIELKNQ